LQQLQYRLFRTRRSAGPNRWDGPRTKLRSNRPAGSERNYTLQGPEAKKEIPAETGASQLTTIFDNTDTQRGVAKINGAPAGFIGIQSYPNSPVAFRDIWIK
jgi:hypothetical protein